MFRKLTGILILLSFLMVKTSALVSHYGSAVYTNQYMDHQETELPDDSKEIKQLEFSLDEEVVPYSFWVDQFSPLEKLNHFSFPEIIENYLSLPNPPPNSYLG